VDENWMGTLALLVPDASWKVIEAMMPFAIAVLLSPPTMHVTLPLAPLQLTLLPAAPAAEPIVAFAETMSEVG
jgi:hypothetical protein